MNCPSQRGLAQVNCWLPKSRPSCAGLGARTPPRCASSVGRDSGSGGRLAELGSDVGDDLVQRERCRVICQLVEQFLRGLFELRGGACVPLVSDSDEVPVGLGVGLRMTPGGPAMATCRSSRTASSAMASKGRPPVAASEDPRSPPARVLPWAMLFRGGCPIQGATGCFSAAEHTSHEEKNLDEPVPERLARHRRTSPFPPGRAAGSADADHDGRETAPVDPRHGGRPWSQAG